MDAKLSNRIAKQYNLGNLVRSLVDGNYRGAGFEHEVSAEMARGSGQKPTGVLVPWQALAKRDLVVGTSSAGGATVATMLPAKSFIDLLRPTTVVARLGATTITGLVGNIAIPRQVAGATAYWVAESGAPTETQAAFDQVPMTPATLGAFTDISRKLALQSSIDIGAFVAADLRASIGQEIDRVVLHGSGTGSEPLGLLNNGDVQVHSLGTNGAALTWADVVKLETEVTRSNAHEHALAYLTTHPARAKLKTTEKVATTGSMIWEDAEKPIIPGEGKLNGYRAVASNLMPKTLTKGSGTNLSAMLYGDFSDIIVGVWGNGLDLMIDPYTLGASGGIRIVAMIDVGIAVRNAMNSFWRINDIVTT